MAIKILRIATRKSPLALWQAEHIGAELTKHWPSLSIELVPMTTSGDQFLKDKLQAIGGKGLFVKELEEALLDGRADIAVHSMKDVPTNFPPGLFLSTICKRHSPFDALIGREATSLHHLAKGSLVGTTSLRRQSQLLALRPDLLVKPLRGNINTRLQRLRSGEYDAILLAVAGLERLGMEQFISEIIPEEQMLPACGQGALGIECRSGDKEIIDLLIPLNDSLSTLCVTTERLVNAQLGGNCHVPIAVYCRPIAEDKLQLDAKVLTIDGTQVITDRQQGFLPQAASMAESCAKNLLARGAAELLGLSS